MYIIMYYGVELDRADTKKEAAGLVNMYNNALETTGVYIA